MSPLLRGECRVSAGEPAWRLNANSAASVTAICASDRPHHHAQPTPLRERHLPAENEERSRSTNLEPHWGHFVSSSLAAALRSNSNRLPHFLHRYSYSGMCALVL